MIAENTCEKKNAHNQVGPY